MWSIENPKQFIGDDILTITPGCKSNYYFEKNIIVNIQEILNTDAIKITIIISPPVN